MIRRRLYVEERFSRLAVWSLRTAIFALPVAAIGIGLYATETLDFRSALYVVLAGVAISALALLLALAGFVVIWNEGLRGLGRVIGAATLAMALLAPTMTLAALGARMPAVTDITTDPQDPPGFQTLALLRPARANPLAYLGAPAAAVQRDAYPGIKPMTVDTPPDEVYKSLMSLVTRHKWLVVDAVPPRGQREGRIEAVARSLPFGLRDDVVIRIRRTAEGTRIDMRSLARTAERDFGSNARRIDQLFAELADAEGRRRR